MKCKYCNGTGVAIEMTCPECKGIGEIENELDRKIQTKENK
jgi:DnaJ-class molecular chaperone